MVYETSYGSGRRPFVPDVDRGHWSSPTDFVFACLGLTFKLDMAAMHGLYFSSIGLIGFVPYLLCLAIYIVPILVIQSFLGQFSSSGFLAAFRISPLFKGMGYVSLGLNILILIYYSLFVTIPLWFMFQSLRPTLPWSCDNMENWTEQMLSDEIYHFCNLTHHSGNDSVDVLNAIHNTNKTYHGLEYHVPSTLYFQSHLFGNWFYNEDNNEYPLVISWELLLCCIVLWSMIAIFFYKCFNTEKFGVFLRYAVCTVSALVVAFGVALAFLLSDGEALKNFFFPNWKAALIGALHPPFSTSFAFGGGWGVIVALASCNKFKANVMRYSWIIGIGQMLVSTALGLVGFLVDAHFEYLLPDYDHENVTAYSSIDWLVFTASASALSDFPLPNIWCGLFYGMLTLAGFIVMTTQYYSILISVFDEFTFLRVYKCEFIFTSTAFLMMTSLLFCSTVGLTEFTSLAKDSLVTQTTLNLLLLLVVLWVYGRERFQRDIEFMLSQRFSTWKVNMLRFLSPLILLFVLLIALIISFVEHKHTGHLVLVLAIVFIGIPTIFIPGYGIFYMFQTSGSLKMRFLRCCRPTDWYPVEAEDRQRYEEAVGNADATHQLEEVREEENPEENCQSTARYF